MVYASDSDDDAVKRLILLCDSNCINILYYITHAGTLLRESRAFQDSRELAQIDKEVRAQIMNTMANVGSASPAFAFDDDKGSKEEL